MSGRSNEANSRAKITARIKIRFQREEWPVLIKAMLDEHSIEDDYRIVFVEKTNITANFQGVDPR